MQQRTIDWFGIAFESGDELIKHSVLVPFSYWLLYFFRTKLEHEVGWPRRQERAPVQTALSGCLLQGQRGVASLCQSRWWQKEKPQSQ